jgi:hypothetical protein
MRVPYVSLDIRTPLSEGAQPVPSLDVNPLVTNVEFTTMRIGLLSQDEKIPKVYPSLREPALVGYGYHVVARIGSYVVFEGLIEEISLDRTGFAVTGYGPAAGNWGSVDSPSEDRTRTENLARVAAQAIRWWQVGEIPAPDSPSYRTWAEMQYLSTSQILDALTKEGSGGTPWIWHVYDDRVLRILERLVPDEATYRLSYDKTIMHVVGNSSEVVDAVRGSYRDTNGVSRTTAWIYREGFDPSSDWPRQKTVPSSGPVGTIMQVLQTWMAEHSHERLTGTIALDNWRGLPLPSGIEVPAYTVRYGDSVEFEGYGTEVTFLSQTTCNLSTGVSRFVLDTPSPSSLAGLLGRLQDLNATVRTGRDPVTGTRL